MKTKREASQLGIVSYDTALEALNGKGSVVLCNNTTLAMYYDDTNTPFISVRLHSTEVVTYYPSGSIKLDSGGYRTVTTKDRINRFSPFVVYSVKGEWYVTNGAVFPFSDGMVLNNPME